MTFRFLAKSWYYIFCLQITPKNLIKFKRDLSFAFIPTNWHIERPLLVAIAALYVTMPIGQSVGLSVGL